MRAVSRAVAVRDHRGSRGQRVAQLGWLRELLLVLVIVGTPTLSIAYVGLQAYSREAPVGTDSALNDSLDYLDVYSGRQDPFAPGAHPSHTRIDRVGVPYLARLVPVPPGAFFTPQRTFSPTFDAALHFAVLNALFVAGTSTVLYYLGRGFGQTRAVGLLTGLLYTGLTFVVYDAGLPMVDPGALFCMGLAALAIQRRNGPVFFMTMVVGMLIKETMILMLIFVALAPYPWRERVRQALIGLPSVGSYLWLRFIAAPAASDYVASGRILTDILGRFAQLATANAPISILLAFGLLWVPFLYVLVRGNPPLMLRRWAWSVPILLLLTVLWGTASYARLLLMAYPAVLPLAAVGLGGWVADLERTRPMTLPAKPADG